MMESPTSVLQATPQIIPQNQTEVVSVSSTTTSSQISTVTDSLSKTVLQSSEGSASQETERNPSIILQGASDYISITRNYTYRTAPGFVRNVPTYVISGLVQMDQHAQSPHQVRNALIGMITDEIVEGALRGVIGATPAGIAIMVADVAVEPIRDALPSWQQLEKDLGSKDSSVREQAENTIHVKGLAEIFALPSTASHVISKLAQAGFQRLASCFSSSSSSSSSSSCSSSYSSSSSSIVVISSSSASSSSSFSASSSSSLTSFSTRSSSFSTGLSPLPILDDMITLAREHGESNKWEIIRLKVIEQIDAFSPIIPSGLSTVTSSNLTTFTTNPISNLSVDSDQSTENINEEQVLEEEREGKRSEITWTGVQIHVPLDNLKKIRISTGVQFGQEGQFQTGVSTDLRQPLKNVQISSSVQGESGSVGVSTSIRHPVKDAHVGTSLYGVGVSTSFRHPAKDVNVTIPLAPCVGLSIPFKKPSQARVVIGVPFVPGASFSVSKRQIEKPVEQVVKAVIVKPVTAVGKEVEQVVKVVAQPVGKGVERVARNFVRQPIKAAGKVFKKLF